MTKTGVGIQGTDFWIDHAEREINDLYGARVSIVDKAKTLHKFGHTDNADSGVKTTVANFQDDIVNETYATTNSVDSVVSTSASDTGPVTIEGHTIDGSGNLTFVVQTATLAGQTPVTLTTALARCTRIVRTDGTFASPASELVGNVAVYDSALSGGGVTAGKPDVDAAVKCLVVAGRQQSQKAATALSSVDFWIVHEVSMGLSRSAGSAVNVDGEMEIRRRGGVFLPVGIEFDLRSASTSNIFDTLLPYIIVPANADVRLVATSDTNNTSVSGYMRGVLAKVV